MPVELITERLLIQPNRVFIIPEQRDLHVLEKYSTEIRKAYRTRKLLWSATAGSNASKPPARPHNRVMNAPRQQPNRKGVPIRLVATKLAGAVPGICRPSHVPQAWVGILQPPFRTTVGHLSKLPGDPHETSNSCAAGLLG